MGVKGLRLWRRDSEKMLPKDKELFCLWRILFICCFFASKPHNLHTTAPSINRFLVQLWVSPVSAVIANMVMEDVEQRALATSPQLNPFSGNNM